MGLARSDESAKRLEAVRAAVQCGDLEDSPALQRRPRNPLALSILRFSTTSHGAATFPQWGRLIVVQWRRWELRLPARTGHSCSLQAWWAWLCRVATEDDELVETAQMRPDPAGLRVATAPPALSLRGIGVRSCVVRLRPTVTATTASPARLPSPPANVASQRMAVRERSAGRRCIARTLPGSHAWHLNRPQRARCCMPPPPPLRSCATSARSWLATSRSRPHPSCLSKPWSTLDTSPLHRPRQPWVVARRTQ